MNKIRIEAIIDEDIFDELCTYKDSRVLFTKEPIEVSEDDIIEEKEDYDG